MSQINPSPIASSVAQGALQQSQAARARDAVRNEAARRSQRMRKLFRKQLEAVQDALETRDQGPALGEEPARRVDDQPRSPEPPKPEDSAGPQLDIRA